MDKANALQENDITGVKSAPATPAAGPAAPNTSRKASAATRPPYVKNRCISRCNEGSAMAAGSSSAAVPLMPWFGMDIGGTLAKLVYFEPTDDLAKLKEGEENAILSNIKLYLTKNKAYGDSGHRDAHIQMDNVTIDGRRGSLHFIRFPTSAMDAFVELAKEKGMAKLASTVCATGGGAYKFQELIEREVKLKMHKFDELNSLIRGVDFMERSNPNKELFYYADAQDGGESGAVMTPYASREIYPFMLVNIGSGVSILNVEGPEKYKRVHGTSLGGGTFLGLTCLLTDCQSFEEAMELAAKGDNRNVDKLVKDIYGGSYERFGLDGDLVASSFGQMNCPERRQNARPEDLARATLVTITNNIGSLARLCARAEGLDRVVFVGNFLRINSISMKMLASAMDYWSDGAMKALFCEHEGYFGAIGCLLELMAMSERAHAAQTQR